MATKEFTLPSEADLTVEEINLSTPSLRAAAFHLGKFCETPSKEFILCKTEERDPRKCVDYGKTLTACGMDFFRRVKKECLQEFTQFANCIDKSSPDYSFNKCRKTQSVYDKCMLENLDMPKPQHGYYCRAKVLDTERPRPRGYYTPDFPNAPKDIVFPPVEEIPDARHGSRVEFFP